MADQDPSPANESKRLNVGGFGNFWTGTAKAGLLPIGFKHPRERIFLNGIDIADVIETEDQDFQHQIRYYAEPGGAINLGVVHTSYVMGYGMGWEVVRKINLTVNYKSPFGEKTELTVPRSYQVTSVDRVQMKMVAGVTWKAPVKSKKNTASDSKDGGAIQTKVKQLSIGCPSYLLDKEGNPIRKSARTRKRKEADVPIGLGICEDYFDKYLEVNKALANVVSSFNIVKETKPNFLRPSITFSGPPSGGAETGGGGTGGGGTGGESNLIEGILSLPPSTTIWTGTSPGVRHGSNGEQIPMRIPAYERDLLFEDML